LFKINERHGLVMPFVFMFIKLFSGSILSSEMMKVLFIEVSLR
jgi:hypothetical protein